MPTYEYECTKCQHRFEKFQAMNDKPVSRCPRCRCKVRRMFGTGAGIIFKGGGFYSTDYRSENYRNAAKRDEQKPAGEPAAAKKETARDAPAPKSARTDAAASKP